jgi:hypothetical protein
MSFRHSRARAGANRCPRQAKAEADLIINAGRKRRGEVPLDDAPISAGPISGTPDPTEAQAIIDAGKRRRGEIE